MGLAFGVVSGFGPIAGLYGAAVTGLCAALFGGTNTQIAGPTGPIAIVMASVVATFVDRPGAVAAVILLAGLLQVLFGSLRFGHYLSLLPYPVTSGFATAVGGIIIVMQLNPVIGLPPAADIIGTLRSVAGNLGDANPASVLTALACLAACQLMPLRLRRIAPVHLTVLVAGSALVALAGLDLPTLTATGLPDMRLPPFAEIPWREIWLAAIVLALTSSLDSLLTSRAADVATQSLHDSNRELVGQGIGNAFAGVFGVLPGAGSTFRTLANIEAGGRTPLSAIFHCIVIAAVALLGVDLIGHIPASVLAGILIYIGLGIIDWRYVRRFLAVPKTGVAIMLTTCLLGLFVNIVTGAAAGVILASLAYVKRMADLQLEELGLDDAADGATGLSEPARDALKASNGRTLLIRLGGPLAFGAANGLSKRLTNLAKYDIIVLDFTNVPDIDESGIIAFENLVSVARDQSQPVFVAGLRRAVARPILRFGLSDTLRYCTRFSTRLDALRTAARAVARNPQPEN